jgi:hypothetical protein
MSKVKPDHETKEGSDHGSRIKFISILHRIFLMIHEEVIFDWERWIFQVNDLQKHTECNASYLKSNVEI